MDELVKINSAAASDGGSLWLGIGDGELGASFVLNRSIKARGTLAYEMISNEQGVLSGDGLTALRMRLLSVRETMTADDPHRKVVDEFLGVLQRQAPTEV